MSDQEALPGRLPGDFMGEFPLIELSPGCSVEVWTDNGDVCVEIEMTHGEELSSESCRLTPIQAAVLADQIDKAIVKVTA